MAGTRSDILNAIAARVDANPLFTTVKRTLLNQVEIRRYKQADLPAVFIVDPLNENYAYSGSRHADNTMDTNFVLYFVHWDPDGVGPDDLSTLMNALLVAIHSDISNSGYGVNTSVTSITRIVTKYPLQGWSIRVKLDFYKDYTTR